MFLFESKEQKTIREDVQKNMEICISNSKKYNEAKDVLLARLKGSDQKVIEMIVDNIKATIKNSDYLPIRKYQAILLLKDLMQTHNKSLGKYVVKKMLKRLIILAQHKSGMKDQKEQQRGKDIFGQIKKDQEQYATKFFNILLTALQEWGKNWPKAPDGPYKDFQREYNDLLMNGVQFPKQRPKDLRQITGVSAPKNSRQQTRNSSNFRQFLSQPPKRQQNHSPLKSKAPKNDSTINDLRGNLDKFYQDIKQPLDLLSSLLPGCDAEQLPVLKDIISQIQKDIQTGNDFIISIEGNANFKTDEMKLQKCFDFVNKIQKDLRILTKKPQQMQTFKSKYVKLSNQLLQTLNKNKTLTLSPSKIEQNSHSIDKSKPPSQKQHAVIPDIKVEGPIIKNTNRYASVQGNQVLQQFTKTVEFQSNSGQSVNSDRFGSFGAPNTQRHRASAPRQATSPQVEKNKQKQNSDRRSEKEQNKKPVPVIAQEKSVQLSKFVFSQHQNKNSQIKTKLESQKIFQQYQKKSQIESIKKIGNIEGNNSFGLEKFNKKQEVSAQQEDFFAKVEQNNGQNREVSYNPRRKKNPQKQDNQDFFNPKIPSKIDSSKLSGFNFSQIGRQSLKNDNINEIDNLNKQSVVNEKKEFEQNPFALDTSHNSQKKQLQNSNDFQKYDPNKSNSQDFFQKSIVKQVQANLPTNPFATGNFGNIPENNIPVTNPFDKQSMRSRYQSPRNNPFGNQSFASKKSKQSKMNQDSKKNLQNENYIPKDIQNPFQSNFHQGKDPFFDSKLNLSANVANPFETSTHKSNKSKNPFEEVQQFFRPPTKPSIEGLSERNSFKNIQTQIKPNILGGNLGFNNSQPIRDSLILSARVENNKQQYGLNFSQFDDVGEPKRQSSIKASNPFNMSGDKKDNNSFSGFSLSNFPQIGQEIPKISEKPNQLNVSAADFFANYQKQSINSKKSKQREKSNLQQPKIDFFASELSKTNTIKKEEKGVFQDFNMSKQDQSFPNKSKVIKYRNYEIQKQKTVLSGDQRSFDYSQLDKVSAIHQKPKVQQDFDGFTQWGKATNKSNKSIKQGIQVGNKSQKQLSWGDFDRSKTHSQKEKSKSIKQQSYQQKNVNKFLQVESKLKKENLVQKTNQPNMKINNQLSRENSLQLNLEDFAPISKKGIQWNPLAKIASLKQSPVVYNVNDKKIQQKKLELLQRQKEYHQKLKTFRFYRDQNQKIRNIFTEKMKNVEEVIQQKNQYEQILKKIKEANSSQQNKIEEIHLKIKKAVQVKQKILQKQKQLYQITKNQVYSQQKTVITQRSMSNKWQMFNKTLQNNRNSMYTLQSHYSHGY